MNILYRCFEDDGEFLSLVGALKTNRTPSMVTGLSDSARSVLLTALLKANGEKALILLPEEKEAYALAATFSTFDLRCFVYPTRDFQWGSPISASHIFEQQRLSVLKHMLDGDFDVVIASIEAACQQTLPRRMLKTYTLRFAVGSDTIAFEQAIAKLVDMGYSRDDKVEGPGQFAARGGILDIFSPQYEHPVRMEFFGNEVDSIGHFDVLTQRRFEPLDAIDILPATEVFFTSQDKETIHQFLWGELISAKSSLRKKRLQNELDRLHGGKILSDVYLPLLREQETLLHHAFSLRLVLLESSQIKNRLNDAVDFRKEMVKQELENTDSLLFHEDHFNITFDEFKALANQTPALVMDHFASPSSLFAYGTMFSFTTRQSLAFANRTDTITDDLRVYTDNNWRVMMVCENSLEASNLTNILKEKGICCTLGDETMLPKVAQILIVSATKNDTRVMNLPGGFELLKTKFALLTSSGSQTRTTIKKRLAAKTAKEKILSYADLKIGDYVVHVNHGIGVYDGIVNMQSENTSRDFIKLKYAQGDVLYVPCNNLDVISKYIGAGNDVGVKLNRLGGNEWEKAKQRVKKAAADIAAQLIALYAQRQRTKGHAFAPDTPWQKEFEASFEFNETEGQLKATEEIKDDMERPIPMDRLLCGDVGFGKTEVAMRAVFKCVMEGKQAAILVPTTILAWQHYQTVLSRFRGYPLEVELLSRFRTPKQIEKSLDKIRLGKADIVIGTHRLLQKDVHFKDLGLLVVDEEQRFGVTHKEKLKELSKQVDVLTLTATPIPRTMHMAMSGIRDMSVLEEAPEDRFPVQTYVMEHDDHIILEAIRKELRRGGQVFYLINRIEHLPRVGTGLQRELPEARIAVAHGQMDKDKLSDIWKDMMEGAIDILMCTTIIEAGVDVSNANTLIIENSEHFGLSQLHQIRGRVGRSNRRAYAYLTFRQGQTLSEVATKRLTAIQEYTEFGSGFKIAMRDLEIRGAGNILGSEQHGHMDSVGYDLYLRILADAISQEQGGKSHEVKKETGIDLILDAFIPEKYVSGSEMRIDIYKKIASVVNEEDIAELTDELIDRFGDIPQPVLNLFLIAQIKNLCELLGISKVTQVGNEVTFLLEEEQDLPLAALSALAAVFTPRVNLIFTPHPCFVLKKGNANLSDEVYELLVHYKNIKAHS